MLLELLEVTVWVVLNEVDVCELCDDALAAGVLEVESVAEEDAEAVEDDALEGLAAVLAFATTPKAMMPTPAVAPTTTVAVMRRRRRSTLSRSSGVNDREGSDGPRVPR